MKSQQSKLIKTRDALIRKVEKRDAIALSKSDAWHESQKGKEYEKATGALGDTVEKLNEAITELGTFIEKV